MVIYIPFWHGCNNSHTIVRLFSICLFLALLGFTAIAQRELTLDQSITAAQTQSPYYYRIKNGFEKSYWRFQNFKAQFKPQIRLAATIPTFYREINPITQPDGTIEFIRVIQANNSADLNILQNIGFTGGVLSFGTSLQRTDNFSGRQSSYFLSSPFRLSYSQNSLLYNQFFWNKQIEPLLFEIAERSYSEEMENTAMEVTRLFFDGLVLQISAENSKNAVANLDTLYQLSKARFAIGTVALTDVLQLELNLLNARSIWNQNKVNMEGAVRNLKKNLGISARDTIVLQVPNVPDLVGVSYEKALEEGRKNRQTILSFQSQRLMADEEVAKAKMQNSLRISFNANLGTQQTSAKLIGSYQNLQNQQYIGVNVDVPIQDWGYRKSQIYLAKANRELVEINIQQEEMNFEQEIFLQVLDINNQREQMLIVQKADSVAQQRLMVTKERYLLGKLGITDLNLALQESTNARHSFIITLRNYWLSLKTLRRLTLYDFILGNTLIYERR